jgi:hypothetical protein
MSERHHCKGCGRWFSETVLNAGRTAWTDHYCGKCKGQVPWVDRVTPYVLGYMVASCTFALGVIVGACFS